MLQELSDHIKYCLDRAAQAQRHADGTADPTLRADYLRLQRSWFRLAQSHAFAESLERFLLTCPTKAATWQWRILEAHRSLTLEDALEEPDGQPTASLVRHGSYEVRLIEFSRKSLNEGAHLWLELFDHHRKETIDSYNGRNLEDTAAAAESLCSKAKRLNQGLD